MAERIETRSAHEIVAKAMEHRRLVLGCADLAEANKWQVKLGKTRHQMVKAEIREGHWDKPEAAHPLNSLEFRRVKHDKMDQETTEACGGIDAAVVIENYDWCQPSVFALD